MCCAALVLPLGSPPPLRRMRKRRSCGDLAGQRLYHRHRYLYRRGPIASYNIGGTTVVSVSDLAGYGFQVEWDPETRWVTVTSAQRPERMPEPDITREVPGTVRGSYYATDIRVLFNGNELEHVYNIGGWMMIPLSEVGKVEMHGFILGNPNFLIGYSRSLCRTGWDGGDQDGPFLQPAARRSPGGERALLHSQDDPPCLRDMVCRNCPISTPLPGPGGRPGGPLGRIGVLLRFRGTHLYECGPGHISGLSAFCGSGEEGSSCGNLFWMCISLSQIVQGGDGYFSEKGTT